MFEDLKGKILTSVLVAEDKEQITFTDINGDKYKMYHFRDCCESVYVEDIAGDIADIINSEIITAEEVVSQNIDPSGMNIKLEYRDDSFTWTFYKLDTIKGGITIRWFGTSNGYYSESVEFEKVENG